MKLSVLVPAFNEENTIETVLRAIADIDLRAVGITGKEIILIDDGSTDDTVTKALGTGIRGLKLIRHGKNLGKGASLFSGLSIAGGDIILIQDADLEYSPSSYPDLIKPIIQKKARVVYGSRFLGKKRPENMKTAYYLANVTGCFLVNLLYGTRLTDPMTCFKVFSRDSVKGMRIISRGFDVEAEITAGIAKKGIDIKEVPVPYRARTFGEGKKFRPVLSLKVLWGIVRFSFLSKAQ